MLKIENLCKAYPTFALKNVSFCVPKGYIVGFIGRNGAGKTTTLKCIMNLTHPDSGKVEIFGKQMEDNELELKQNIGFALGEADYYKNYSIKAITNTFKRFYKNWSEDTYQGLLKRFNLEEKKKISALSSGMRVKYAVTLALSHKAKLLIFDEPTSGLDPVARDELLDLFQQIIEDGEHSILFSTHITSDLDKVADYIVFLRNGEIIADETKDDLLSSHILVKGKKEEESIISKKAIGLKENEFGFTALLKKKDLPENCTLSQENPNLEDLMIYYNKEENYEKLDF